MIWAVKYEKNLGFDKMVPADVNYRKFSKYIS